MNMEIYCEPTKTGGSYIAGVEISGNRLHWLERMELTKREALAGLHSDLHWLANEARRLEIEAENESEAE